jgi:hypothetical protein
MVPQRAMNPCSRPSASMKPPTSNPLLLMTSAAPLTLAWIVDRFKNVVAQQKSVETTSDGPVDTCNVATFIHGAHARRLVAWNVERHRVFRVCPRVPVDEVRSVAVITDNGVSVGDYPGVRGWMRGIVKDLEGSHRGATATQVPCR